MTVYFDGHCNLCNGFVDFLIRRDRRRRLRYASLQGETARARLPAEMIRDLRTVVLENDEGRLSVESSAVLNAIAALGGVYSLVRILIPIPRFVRDPIYRLVAGNRYRWFGRRDSCRVPTPEERERFLS